MLTICNRYFIILYPRVWSFELIECWLRGSIWATGKTVIITNYELHDGKLRGSMDGGYYAARFAALKYLEKTRRQATIIIVREITPDYFAPVGVWQVRESILSAFDFKPIKVDSLIDIWENLRKYIETPTNEILSNSILFRKIMREEKITKYF